MQEFFFKLVEETDSYCAMSYHGDEPHVIIPSTHWGRPVTMLFDDLFKNHHEITSVVIPDSVREIGGFAFDSCDNLLNITLPANLENLWQYAFVRSSVEEVILPPGIRYIYPFTFKDCKRLRRVVCNDSLEKIWMSAFDGCHHLSQLLYGPNVTIVPN
ncbi:MAG: leucine-rich repeat domain-containing protein [Bacteroidales bacterium]|nr:leucine-rich repeat domain-containing protein [Bacteroidales bacterium]MBR3434336.1 leucine-rich repeat domain-containing protein [Bacteroidales bacterium]